jgi:hypothetical protein
VNEKGDVAPQEFVKFLNQFKNDCVKEVKPDGSFMHRLNFAIAKATAEAESFEPIQGLVLLQEPADSHGMTALKI